MTVPTPTPILRIIHIDNLSPSLIRKGLYASSQIPLDGLSYKAIHNPDIQRQRSSKNIYCGPKGTIKDYIPFYFGYLSPMLLQLHTNKVEGYTEGQKKIIYLVSSAQKILEEDIKFVFSDGHGLKNYTKWYDDIANLDKISWNIVYQKQWADQDDDNDRQRKKQAEFLVHKFCPWQLIEKVVVIDQEIKNNVLEIFKAFPQELHRSIEINKKWYY